jgi:L-threonylcarbamoyladenylate synthase
MSEQRRIDLGNLSILESLEVAMRLSIARLAIFPTDTVYGVGGALRPEVGEAIVAAKGREPGKPLQVIFPNRELLLASIEFTRSMTNVLLRLLPGPLTVVVPYPPGFTFPPPAEATFEKKAAFGLRRNRESFATLGIRVPHWPSAARIMATLNVPLVASSANRAGGPAPAALADVDPGLLAACDLVLDGGTAGGIASTVVDFSGYDDGHGWRILREGAVSAAGIDEMLTRKREDLPA